MKKKASLLISGITTVAMLAVAVGSFAAWDTLTAVTQPNFSATSGNPVIIEVAKGVETFTGNKLVPTSADSTVKGAKDVTELTGVFTPTLTDEGNKAKIQAKITIKMGADSSETTTTADNNLEYKLINTGTDGKGTTEVSFTNDTVFDLSESGSQYKLVVTMKDPSNVEAAKAIQGMNITADVVCTAMAKTAS